VKQSSLGFLGIPATFVLSFVSIKSSGPLIMHYALMVAILTVVLASGGWRMLFILGYPLFLLFLSIPLPGPTILARTAKLQLISSDLGLWGIRQFGIPVFLEGNIIDLGEYQLFVAEACSGLRYLFSLVTLGLVIAYMIKAPLWMKVLTVLVTFPISIFMNSLRIAVTGILVKNMGISAADGFFHDFEGLVIFDAAFFLLVGVVWCASWFLTSPRPSLAGLLAQPEESTEAIVRPPHPKCLVLLPLETIVGLVVTYGSTVMLVSDQLITPPRTPFALFPDVVGESRNISTGQFSDAIEDSLNADDYYLGDFNVDVQVPLNLLIA